MGINNETDIAVIGVSEGKVLDKNAINL